MKATMIPLASLIVGMSVVSVHAVVLAEWTFETSRPLTFPGPYAPEGGVVGSSASVASTNSGGTISNPDGNGSVESFNSTGWQAGEYYQFTTSSTGFGSLKVSYAQAATNTGPRDFQFLYSTDGVTYVAFGAVYAGPAADFSPTAANPSNVITYDLSAIPGLDNQPAIGFRVAVVGTASEGGGTIAGGGTFRVDDVTISAVPETSATLLAGFGALGLLTKRRR